MVARGVENLDPRLHVGDVVELLGTLPGEPPRVPAAVRRSREALARRICQWSRGPERLGRWLLRCERRFGVANIAGYLRVAAERGGDPGTVLEGDAKNRLGRGAETLPDFTAATEKALEGPRVDDVARLVATSAAVVKVVDPELRSLLRLKLKNLASSPHGLEVNRPRVRVLLLQLVGTATPTDAALTDALRGVLPVEVARKVLAA